MAAFVKHTNCEQCGSTDNKAVYDDGSSHCFGCGFTVISDEYKQELKEKKPLQMRVRASAVSTEQKQERVAMSKEMITDEENEELKSRTELSGKGYRGISDEVLKFYGCRTEYDDDGDVYARYYPYTIDGKLSGYKVRKHPKTFGGNIGNTGKDCDLYGQFRFKNGGKYLLIVEGEEKTHAAYQMFLEYARSKSSEFVTAVVGLGQGVGSTKQLANAYEFVNSFDTIYLGMDSDEPGQEAVEKLVAVLPKGKVKIVKWSKYKDADEYLLNDAGRKFLNDFYNATTYVPAGVVGSSELYQQMLDMALVEKVPLPPFMKKLDNMLGSIELGTIGILAAGSGAAKTTFANECLYFWLFNSPHKVGVVSLELTCAQYGQALLSRHIEKRISSIRDPQEKFEFLKQSSIKDKADSLFKNNEGHDRFMLIDEREGAVSVLQDKIEELVISCGCRVIILDPVSDLQDGLSIDEQAVFSKWMKGMVKRYNMTFILIAHIRKSGSNKDAASSGSFIPEEAIMGSSTLFKSASWVVMMQRDKYNDDPIVRNTTRLTLSKNRSGGETGNAGEVYYDPEEHKLYDYKELFGKDFEAPEQMKRN
jgi:hypothetical protein